MRKLFIIAALLSSVNAVVGQSFYSLRRERSLMLVAGTGSSSYFGELKNDGDYIDAKLNANVGLQLFLTPRISARAEATWFSLKGADSEADDNSRKRRNLSFSSNNLELSFTGAISFFPQGNRYYRRPGFNVYGFGGLGVIYYNPTTIYNGKKYALQPLETEGVHYSKVALVLPFGLGARLKLTPFLNLSIEGGYRKTFTDYLDDVSTVHKGSAAFSDPIAGALSDRRPELPGLTEVAPGTQRGSPSNNDGYFLLNAKLEYYLPGNFQLGGGSSKKKPSYNQRRKSPTYRYNKRGGIKR